MFVFILTVPKMGLCSRCGHIVRIILVRRLPDHAPIFFAEVQALQLALDTINSSSNNQFLILSDLLSCLLSIRNRNIQHSIILEITIRLHRALHSGSKIVLMWLRATSVLLETLQSMAPQRLRLIYQSLLCSCIILICLVLLIPYILSRWQRSRDENQINKLHKNQDRNTIQSVRRDEVLIHRLRVASCV